MNVTKHPTDFSDEGLCKTLLLYRELASKSSFDEMYLSMLESEVERRREFSFNRAVIDELLSC
jgi:hypothetical protein